MHVMNTGGIYEGIVEAGLRLAELPEDEGGFSEYFQETDDADLRIEDEMLRSQTALLMENAKRWMASKCKRRVDERGRFVIDEVTRSALVGGWSDYLFPIIRASFPTNPVNDIVSVQPTTRRTATIVFWNWIVGRSGKPGSFPPGFRLFDANVGKQDAGFNFSNEVIENEPVGTGDTTTTHAGTLSFNDGGGVRAGTVNIKATISVEGAVNFFDDGNGGFTTDATDTIAAGTIDYVTGAFSITMTLRTFDAVGVTATYRWDSEGSKLLPEVDVQIISSTVETERRALKVNYSIEAMQDIMAEFGVSLEPNLVSGAAEQVNFEIARQLIHEMWVVAPVDSTFPITGPTEFNQQDHFKDLVFNLNGASNNIWRRTQKGYGNWIIVDEGASSVIESLPAGMFVMAPRPASVHGLHFIGTLLGKYRVYKDIHLDKEPGASADGNILMGFKGTQFYEAGLVWSPYQLLYTTDPLTTADFITQRGMASRYATKMVNPDMYVRIDLSS